VVIASAFCVKKIRFGMHSDPKSGWRGGGVIYIDARKKVPERRSGLRFSEKELRVPSQKYLCNNHTLEELHRPIGFN
jgi:hypothetical protein